jgi:hypothetical protein
MESLLLSLLGNFRVVACLAASGHLATALAPRPRLPLSHARLHPSTTARNPGRQAAPNPALVQSWQRYQKESAYKK